MADIFHLHKLTYVVVLGAAVLNLAAGIIDPLAGPYLESLGSNKQEVGTILSARFLVVAFGSIPFAILASKIGNTRILFFTALTGLASSYFILFVDGTEGMYYFYISLGFGQAAAAGPGAAIIAENKGNKRIAAFSLFSITWMVPPALGAMISGIWFNDDAELVADNIKTIFPLIAVVTVIGVTFFGIMLIKFHREDTVETGTLSVRRQFRIIFAPAIAMAIVLLILANFLSGGGAGATLPFLPLYLQDLGADAKQISWLVVILNLAMSIATQMTAPLSRKFGELQVYAFAQFMSIVCLLNIVFTDDLAISAIFFIFRGMFANMTVPITQSLTFHYVNPKVRGIASAVITNIRWIGWSIASPISGAIIDEYSFELSFVFTSIIYLVSTIIFIYVILRREPLEKFARDPLGRDKTIIADDKPLDMVN
ncbi:MAG: MFS transporter [Candidatus Heimdallarchaeota archaeon]|nr:MFS transporter [Candidatus Heimdallarchaeota archaeon]